MEIQSNLEDIKEAKNDSELTDLYFDARKKLEELKLQLREADDGQADTTSFLASIQKVSDWQKSLPPTEGPPVQSSCYGSLPASPTSPCLDPNESHFNSINIPRDKTQEIDSGCPGSDRSTLWLSYLASKRMSPSTRSNSKSKENVSNSLYNLEEESHLPSPKAKSLQSPVVTPRDIVNMNNDFVRSITIERQHSNKDILATSTPKNIVKDDFSSDERDEAKLQSDVLATPVRSLKRLSTCKNLFPGVESHDLAQQIDNEILELRNFFDDHREEMMYLLHGNKDPLVMNNSLPFIPTQNVVAKDNKMSHSLTNFGTNDPDLDSFQFRREMSGGSSPDLPDPSQFYLLDHPSQSLQEWKREESESEPNMDPTLRIRKMEFLKRRKKKEKHRRSRQFSDEAEDLHHPVKQNIHSFFPKCAPGDQREDDIGLDLGNDDNVVIPMLNLSDLTSEVTAPDMSLISEAFSVTHDSNHHEPRDHLDSGCYGAEMMVRGSKTSRSIACDTIDLPNLPTMKCPSSTQTTPGRLDGVYNSSLRAFNKSLPALQKSTPKLLDELLDVPNKSQQVIIINQSDCDHKKKKKEKRKKQKQNEELKELLKSLDSATVMAEKLRQRSETLLENLNHHLL